MKTMIVELDTAYPYAQALFVEDVYIIGFHINKHY